MPPVRMMIRIPKLKCPIVFIHGLLGFDTVRVGKWVLADYWPGIPGALRNSGNRVFVATVNPIGSISERAAQLQQFIQLKSPQEPVHLIAHSMGGLDSRYMISRLGMASRALTLTTIGTPHRGSPFADWAMHRLEPSIGKAMGWLGLSRRSVRDLTVANCQKFNREVPDAPEVRYFSVAGRFQPRWITPTWKLTGTIVEKAEGPNDGVVSIASATYGEDCQVWDGDHMSIVNWTTVWERLTRNTVDRVPFYAQLLQRLKDEGY